MKLLRIHVDNFGKLNDLTMDFTEGINVIKEPNAWGKSTIAAFIKVMLYGFDSKKAAGAYSRERTYYQPWQGGTYGGELDFSVGKRSYRISRSFGATEKTDVFHIYDLETNLPSVDFTKAVGEELFDLDSNSFRRSVFIAQDDCESSTSDAINAKLGNLAANTNDINNYETAQEYLKGVVNALTPNRATGSMKRRKGQILELEEETRGKEESQKALRTFFDKKREAEAEKRELTARREELARQLKLASEDSRRRELQKQYRALCEEVDQKLKAMEEFAQTFPIGVPDQEGLSEALDKARALEEKKIRLEHLAFHPEEAESFERLSDMFAGGMPTELDIDEAIGHFNVLSDLKEEKTRLETSLAERERKSIIVEPLPEKPRKVSGLSVAAIVLEAVALIVFIGAILAFLIAKVPPYYLFIGVALMVLATALIIFAGAQGKKKTAKYEADLAAYSHHEEEKLAELSGLKKQTEEKSREVSAVIAEADGFLKKYGIYCGEGKISAALYELKGQTREYIRLADRRREMDELELECRELEHRIRSYADSWEMAVGENPAVDLSALQTKAAQCRNAEQEAVKSKTKKEAFEEENDTEELLQELQTVGDLEEINAEIAELDGKVEEVRLAIEQYGRQAEDLKASLDALDEKTQELEALYAAQEEEGKRFSVVSKTQEYLQKAKEHFTARYMAPISEAFRKYYGMIPDTQQDEWAIDANVALKKREQGELRDVGQLSAGYQDLIGVCMRLALVDAMYQEEKPFLILDDPFVNLDEEKTSGGMELLKRVASEYQTIYFTCHKSRTPA